MPLEQFSGALMGGVMIGMSASILLLLNGRVFGVSGILAGALLPKAGDTSWRVAVILGLFSAGLIIQIISPELLVEHISGSTSRYVLAGLLVGFGTQLGSGCTSGHGVCGISRLSRRSIVATLTFILTGVITVAVVRLVGGGI